MTSRSAAIRSTASLAIATALAAAALAQSSDTRAVARAARGTVGSIEVTYREAPLRAKALRDVNAPVLVRVTALGNDRYRIDYIGAVTGTYDLLPAIERADGRAPEGLDAGLGSLSVEIFSQLPPNAGTDVFGLSAPGFNFSAHYTSALWAVATLWTAVPAFYLIRRAIRRTPQATAVPPPPEPTTAELLFAAVDAARTRELTADERGQLELRLLQILRRGTPEGDVASAISALRADPRTAAIVRAVESWLHAPEGGDATRALAELDALRAKSSNAPATGGAP
ncbi:MAG: hypothetical protein RLY21_552 [Planctomycetota bacterium]|jgi:hypothetical protein